MKNSDYSVVGGSCGGGSDLYEWMWYVSRVVDFMNLFLILSSLMNIQERELYPTNFVQEKKIAFRHLIAKITSKSAVQDFFCNFLTVLQTVSNKHIHMALVWLYAYYVQHIGLSSQATC